MEIIEPSIQGFTIYSKSGCHLCSKIKSCLKEKNLIFNEINCDEYLIEDRDFFLSYLENKIGKPYKTFPIVFHDSSFIGGYNEAIEWIDKLLLSFEDIF